jgi:hypothetical protein
MAALTAIERASICLTAVVVAVHLPQEEFEVWIGNRGN